MMIEYILLNMRKGHMLDREQLAYLMKYTRCDRENMR